jgi:hypothetical protein
MIGVLAISLIRNPFLIAERIIPQCGKHVDFHRFLQEMG